MLPILLIILAGLLDLGRAYYAYVAVTDAAAEGAAYAAINPQDSARAEVVERAQEASGGLIQLESDMVQVECPVVGSGEPVTVSVNYTFTLVTPFMSVLVPDGELMLRGIATEVILEGTGSTG